MSIVTLPHDEIDRLWFGDLEFVEGEPFPKEAIKRWFGQSADFDRKCKFFHVAMLG